MTSLTNDAWTPPPPTGPRGDDASSLFDVISCYHPRHIETSHHLTPESWRIVGQTERIDQWPWQKMYCLLSVLCATNFPAWNFPRT